MQRSSRDLCAVLRILEDKEVMVTMGGAEFYADYVIMQSEWYKKQFEQILSDYKKFDYDLNFTNYTEE